MATPAVARERAARSWRVLLPASLLGAHAVLCVLYWITFFTSDVFRVQATEVYLAFESAFPLPDSWMVLCSLTGMVGLLRGARWGEAAAFLASGSMMFLALIDLAFALQQGFYARFDLSAVGHLIIVSGTGAVAIAVLTTVYAAGSATDGRP